MNEEEFKITIRAFYPTVGFDSYDCGDAHVVVSDCLCHDTFGPGFGFKYVRFDDGHVSVCYGECSVDDFWKSDEPEEQPEPKSAKEKLEQAEFVECEVVDDRPLEIGFAQ